MLVKKTFPKFRKRQRNRFWKLKHFEDQEMDAESQHQNQDGDEDYTMAQDTGEE